MFSIIRPKLSIFSMTFRDIFSYRADFWVTLVLYVSVLVGMSYFLWDSIFAATGKTSIGGYNLTQMIFYYITSVLIMRAAGGPPYFMIAREIYQGELNKYLLYPINYFQFRFSYHYAFSLFYFLQMLLCQLVAILILGLPEGLNISVISLLQSFIAVSVGTYLLFILSSCLEQMAFYADNVWSLSVMLKMMTSLFGGMMIPLSLFPTWARELLEYLPFNAIVSFPVLSFLGKLSNTEFLRHLVIAMIWAYIFTLISKFIWNRAIKQYAGIGI